MAKHENKDVHTMIGADAVIQGNITCQGGVAVYGKVFGDVTSEGPVRVARGGEESRSAWFRISTKRGSNLSYAGNRGRCPVPRSLCVSRE